MAVITIDGVRVATADNANVLEALLRQASTFRICATIRICRRMAPAVCVLWR